MLFLRLDKINPMQQNQDNAIDLLQFIWNKRKPLIVITLIAAIISAGISLIITPKFQSVVTLYPAMSNTVAFTDEFHSEQSATSFGEEEQAEQMIQILKSADVRNRIIWKYDLMKHYDIDTASKTKMTELNLTYEENIGFRRTAYGSVEISVMDTDPVTAANIANDIAKFVDSAKNRMISERAKNALIVAKAERDKLKTDIKEIVDSMSSLSALGVVNNESRPALLEALANAKDVTTRNIIQKKIDATDKFGSIYANMEFQLDWMNVRLSTKDAVYEQLKSDANLNISHKFEVEKAYPAEKKAYPVRWLMVAVSTFSGLLFGIVLLLALTKIKQLKAAE